MAKKAATIALVVLLSGCGSLPFGAITSALGGSSSNDGVQVGTEDITIGQKKEDNDISTQVGDNSQQQAGSIVNVAERMPTSWLVLIVLLAGWAIPDPQTMGRGLLSFFKTILPWG